MMKKRFVALTIVSLLLIAGYTSASNVVNQSAGIFENQKLYGVTIIIADIYVDDDADPSWYDETHVKTINEGIANATEGNIIFAYNGTYHETIKINKTINLVGENNQNTIIDGERTFGNVLSVYADFVNISNFTIQNCSQELDFPRAGIRIYSNYTTVKNNIITNNQQGIEIGYLPRIYYKCYNNQIIDNLFLDNFNLYQDNDLVLFSSYDNIICGNDFINEKSVMYSGISLFDSGNNLICENSFTGKFDIVLYLEGSNNNTIRNNDITDGFHFGIRLIGCDKNDIHHNNIEDNFQGISLKDSNHNKIHHNNFKRCFIKSTFIQSSFNRWYRNYWGRPKILPQLIFGRKGLIFPIPLIPWLNFDIFPKLIPNKI